MNCAMQQQRMLGSNMPDKLRTSQLPAGGISFCRSHSISHPAGAIAAAPPTQQWSSCRHHRLGQRLQCPAGPVDVMPTWTLDQIAGLAFGFVMVAFYFGAQQVDVFVAKQQRRQLGLCEQCGGAYDAASCKQANCPLKAQSSS